MHRAHRYIASFILTAALVVPVSMMVAPVMAAGTPQAVSVRVYDRDHKDYHNWDDNEQTQWGIFLTNNHRPAHEYAKSNRKEQSEYWNWRHSHTN